MSIINKSCPVCSNAFQVPFWQRTRQFCSYPCSANGRKKRGVVKQCERCRADYYCYPYRTEARFCSTNCQLEWQKAKKITRDCRQCGKAFTISSGYLNPRRLAKNRGKRGLYCSQKCCRADPHYA